MHEIMLATAARLSDDALLARLKLLVGRERDATVELVAHLAELLSRKKQLGEGWGSVYAYCRDVLHLSEDAAYNRVAAARAVHRFPVVLQHLAAGFVNVTTVKVLLPVLTPENHLAALAEAKHRTKSAVEVIAARLQPKPDVPSTIRKLPTTSSTPVTLPRPEDDPSPPVVPPPASYRPVLAPLTPERYRLQITVSKETHDKIRRLQDLLCREVPGGDPAAIVDRALDVLLREVEKTKLGATSKPRPPRGTKQGSRTIPAHVRRAVWKRDGGRCAFVGTKDQCPERRYLEWHHVLPHAHQGPPTVENVSLRCRAHNVYESERVFGPFDASVAREARENYAVSGEIITVPERKSA